MVRAIDPAEIKYTKFARRWFEGDQAITQKSLKSHWTLLRGLSCDALTSASFSSDITTLKGPWKAGVELYMQATSLAVLVASRMRSSPSGEVRTVEEQLQRTNLTVCTCR